MNAGNGRERTHERWEWERVHTRTLGMGESAHMLSVPSNVVCSFFYAGTASGPAVTPSNELTDQKRKNCEAVVEQIFALLESKTHARQIMTKNVRMLGRMNGLID